MGRTSDTRVRLLETAMELMYARGYTAVGVQEICARAHVNKGSFYYFFPSKRALALAVIDIYGQRMRTLWEEALAADCAPLERLQQMFERTHDRHRALMATNGQVYGCPIGNLALELSCQDESIRQRLGEMFTGWTDAIERVLHEAVTTGDLPAIDTAITAQTVVAYFEGVMMLAKTQNDPSVLTRLAQGVMHLIEAAARAHPHDDR
jgi:TetR/AcrR family transcriptional repressor of nem operon